MDKPPVRLFYILLIIVFIFFLYKLVDLQIFSYSLFIRIAEENAARINPILAPRGIIYDRYGKVIVKNKPVFSVLFYPKRLKEKEQDNVLKTLAGELNSTFEKLKEKVEKSNNPSYVGIKLASHISMDVLSKIKEASDKLPGISLMVYPLREYPYKNAGIHLLGYIGEINEKELKQLNEQGYYLGDYLGKAGIEKQYDSYLRGVRGGEKLEVDAFGRPIRKLEVIEPIPGNNVKLTIDQQLQDTVDKILGRWKGAVVILDPKNGEVLAMVSHPVYDMQNWEQIDMRYHPFMNLAISAFPAGSVFKPIVLQAALDENLIQSGKGIQCNGFIKLGRRIAKCWREKGHGYISFIEGLVWSCDVAFYELGMRLKANKLEEYARKFGFGKKLNIDLPNERRGLVPSRSWKKRVYKQDWFPGDTINFAIGQGFLLVTPLQMASLYSEIATGKKFKPYLVKEINDQDGNVIFKQEPELLRESKISPKIREALREVVRRGTGVLANVPELPAAGKTGTAENPGRPHAWFISYAPYDQPEIAIAVFIEHGEHGDRAPAEITGQILEWYKKFRFKRKIVPEKPTKQYISHGSYKEYYYPKRIFDILKKNKKQNAQ